MKIVILHKLMRLVYSVGTLAFFLGGAEDEEEDELDDDDNLRFLERSCIWLHGAWAI